MSFLIERARPAHVKCLNELIPCSARTLSTGFYTPAQVEGAIKEIFGIDTQLIADGTYFVARHGATIVGCGGWSRRRTLYGGDQMKGHQDDLLNPEKEPARIRAFFVHPEWGRRGIGSTLMQTCEKAALEGGFSALALVATLPGEQLYRRFGYEVQKRYDHILSCGLHFPLVSMEKKLSS
ncbi:MAG: GNAT family N-acetyltransferase [Bacteroidota bacterium]